MPWYRYSEIFNNQALPVVEVVLRYGEHSVRVPALVDSGADVSALDINHALELGLDKESGLRTSVLGAGGAEIECLSWEGLELEFEQDRFPFTGRFLDFPPGSPRVSLLGRHDFFRRYIIQFWDAAKLIGIDVSPEFPR